MVDDVTREILETSGLFDFFGDVDYTAMKKVIHKKADKYVLIIGIPILASVLEFSEFDQPTLERFRTTFVDTFNEEFFGEIDRNFQSIAESTMKGVYHFLLNNTIALLTRNSMNARSLEIMKDEINETAKEFTFKALKNTALDSVKVAWRALKEDVKAYLKEKETEYKGYADDELDAILNRIDSTETVSLSWQ